MFETLLPPKRGWKLTVVSRWLIISAILFGALPGISQALVAISKNHAPSDPLRNTQSPQSKHSLKSLLSDLESKFKVRFIYESNVVESKQIAEVSLSNDKNLDQMLDELLLPFKLTYEKLDDKTYGIIKKSSKPKRAESIIEENQELWAQALPSQGAYSPNDGGIKRAIRVVDRTITGKVTDENGASIPGVNVILKGNTTLGTSTNADGTYSLVIPEDQLKGAVLIFSYIGYNTDEIQVGDKSSIDIQLLPDITTLNEVVVVGYGQAKKATITGAQTSVKAADIEKTVNTTIEQAIQGRAAGVYVTQNSGQPGGGMSVTIRGVNSINGTNEPLYVIDGVQIAGSSVGGEALPTSSSNPLAGLNPNDIESVEILQGPSATAIYGSRATNGVVIITTKRGKAGDTKINYSHLYTLQTKPHTLEVMNLKQYATMVGDYHRLAGGNTPAQFQDPELLGEGTNWQDALFKNAPMRKHQLSLSGGSEKTTFYLSGEFFNQEGVAVGSSFDRYGLRLNLDHKANKWLSLGTSLNFNQTKDFLTSSQENIISTAIRMSPQVPIKNLDGTWGGDNPESGANQFSPVNPIAIANLTTNEFTRRQVLGDFNVGIDLAKGLKLSSGFSTNLGFGSSTYFIPSYEFGQYNKNEVARLEERSTTNAYWKWDQRLEYTRQLGKHYINVMGIHESQGSTNKSIMASRANFLLNDQLDLELGESATSGTRGGSSQWGMESYLGRLNYNFSEKYILMGTLRADGSVNFGPENKWGIFPSLSAAWRISEEPFFNVPIVDELKLRVETGTTGNQGWSSYYARLSAAPSTWGTGFLPAQYSNPKIRWEQTKTNNIGLNLGLLKNRIQLELDFYIKKTDNLLMEQPLPAYMGTRGQGSVAPPMVNIGSLENRGWGVTLKTVNIDKRGFKWESNFNISGFKTEITKFYNDAAFLNRTSWWMDGWTQRAVVGEAPWLFRGYIEEGVFQSVADLENSALPVDNNGVERPIGPGAQEIWVGDIKFRDISGPDGVPDGKITVDDETFIGNPWPKLFGGLTNDFSYKGLMLSVLLTGTYGNDIYNNGRRVNANPGSINLSRNMLIEAFDYAKLTTDAEGNVVLENPGTNVARISNGPNGNYARHTSKWVEDGSFIRIKNISLIYNLPSALLSKQKLVKGARVGVSAQNVVTFTKYSGYDPEVGSSVGRDVSAANQAIGVDNGRYPLTPIYSFNLGIDF